MSKAFARDADHRGRGGFAGAAAFTDAVTDASSRRGFLARAGRLLLAVGSGGFVAAALRAQKAEAFHFCGHIYTTGSCPHPVGLPRIDSRGLPLRAADGKPVDDLGRPIDKAGRPVDPKGRILLTRTGTRSRRLLARACARAPRGSMGSAPTSTARGTAAAAGTSAGSSTAAATSATESTAMPR